MEIIRQFAKVKNHSLNLKIPENFQFNRVEVLIMPADDKENGNEFSNKSKRTPPKVLAGKMNFHDDLIKPAFLPEHWDALK